MTTAELAAAMGITQGTIRRRLCETGSYFGVVPIKLASGRLLWPADSLERLTRSGGAK
ncbi:sigma-70 family RNA polymerase sigma factor [Paraburkholderia sp. UCT31]|nr:sigma-70 family RNA polymerase sigma factor [Paraburkholderia sp. UCT31]